MGCSHFLLGCGRGAHILTDPTPRLALEGGRVGKEEAPAEVVPKALGGPPWWESFKMGRGVCGDVPRALQSHTCPFLFLGPLEVTSKNPQWPLSRSLKRSWGPRPPPTLKVDFKTLAGAASSGAWEEAAGEPSGLLSARGANPCVGNKRGTQPKGAPTASLAMGESGSGSAGQVGKGLWQSCTPVFMDTTESGAKSCQQRSALLL